MEVHHLVAFELLFIQLHCISMYPCLLLLPLFRVRVQLQPPEITSFKHIAILQIKCSKFLVRINLLPQHRNLILTPAEMSGNIGSCRIP